MEAVREHYYGGVKRPIGSTFDVAVAYVRVLELALVARRVESDTPPETPRPPRGKRRV